MKKSIVMAMALFAASMQGMESDNSNAWSITVGKTKIDVIKGSMLDTYAKEDRTIGLMVLGDYQQQYVNGYRGQYEDKVLGECDIVRSPFLRTWGYDGKKKKIFFPEKENKPVCLTIVEPYLENQDEVEGFQYPSYSVKRVIQHVPFKMKRFEYTDDRVIPEASKDLAFCYEKVLIWGSPGQHIIKMKEKTIALPTLGTRYEKSQFAFPRKEAAHVAVKAILEFILNKPEAYERIELFVEKCSEFDLYKKLLEKSAAEK